MSIPWTQEDKNRAWTNIQGIIVSIGISAGVVALVLVLMQPATKPTPKPLPVEPAAPITLPPEVKSAAGRMVDLEAMTQGKVVRWSAPDGVDMRALSATTIVLSASAPGRYRVLAWTCVDGSPTEAATCILIVGDAPPPGPLPPGPGPQPTPVPQGFRAVLVYESSANMTKEQQQAVYSTKVSAYLDAKCVEGKKGWRRWDKDVDTKYEPQLWKDLWVASKPAITTLPAVVVVVGIKGEVFSFVDEAGLIALLEKYGGK